MQYFPTCSVKDSGGHVVVGEGSEILRLDLRHGEPRWRHVVLDGLLTHDSMGECIHLRYLLLEKNSNVLINRINY